MFRERRISPIREHHQKAQQKQLTDTNMARNQINHIDGPTKTHFNPLQELLEILYLGSADSWLLLWQRMKNGVPQSPDHRDLRPCGRSRVSARLHTRGAPDSSGLQNWLKLAYLKQITLTNTHRRM